MERDSRVNQVSEIEEAVRRAGSQSALARAIGTSQATVWKWLNKDLPVTPALVLKIEATTGVSRYGLRPDVFGPAPAVTSAQLRADDIEIAR